MTWTLLPITAFTDFSARWDSLNQAAGNSLLLKTDFVEPLLQAFSSGKELLAVHGDPEAPSAMAIVENSKLGVWATFQPSQAPIGMWIQRPETSLEELSQSLRKHLPGIALVFSVTQQDPAFLARPQHSGNFTTLDYIDTARVTVTGSFDHYWSERGKNLRQNLRRQRNRLDRESVAVDFSMITDPAEVHQCIGEYGELESAGWKVQTNSAISADNTQGEFYKELLERACKKNAGMIFQYRYNGTLVATDLCLNDGTCLVILKTTYDESITTSSPAMLMRQDAFQSIFDNKLCERIEFYGKVMDWHTKWSNDIRTMYHTNAYSRLITWSRKFGISG
jgi:CelD/BcsL family acetyltransferase involved in cellulose biosynthesis